jgi:HAD superfamily hydrolase (TIGR01509 family)
MRSALQAIVLDFDGVIADSEPLHLRAFQATLAEESVALSAGDYYARYLGYDDFGLLQALARDRELAWTDRHVTSLVARKGQQLQQLMHGDSVLFSGAADFIRAAAAEVPLAIASGAMKHEILEVIDAAGLIDMFVAIVASGDTPESKPSPAPYLMAFERLRQHTGGNLDPRRCVAVEDSKWGLESAHGAGLRCVGVTNSYGADELRGAELVVGGLNELTVAALDRLCAGTLSNP